MNDEERALAEFLLEKAKEHGEFDIAIDDEVEWDLNDLEIQELDTFTEDGEIAWRVGLWGEGTIAHLESRARYNPPGKAHPAEYSYEDVPLLGEIIFRPHRFGCTDEVTIRIEYG